MVAMLAMPASLVMAVRARPVMRPRRTAVTGVPVGRREAQGSVGPLGPDPIPGLLALPVRPRLAPPAMAGRGALAGVARATQMPTAATAATVVTADLWVAVALVVRVAPRPEVTKPMRLAVTVVMAVTAAAPWAVVARAVQEGLPAPRRRRGMPAAVLAAAAAMPPRLGATPAMAVPVAVRPRRMPMQSVVRVGRAAPPPAARPV